MSWGPVSKIGSRQKPRKPTTLKKKHNANGVVRFVRASYGGHGPKSTGWWELVHKVLERDRYRCRKCGRHRDELKEKGISLQVNHIKLVARGGKDDMLNLQAECEECHAKNPYHKKVRKGLKLKRKGKS